MGPRLPPHPRLHEAITALGHPAVAALTATAAPPVREEIAARLGLRDPLVVVQGCERPDLHLEVVRVTDEAAKRREVVLRVATSAEPDLLHAATHRDAQACADELADLGPSARAYHAGLTAAEREQVHEAFLAGELDVVAATSAFGTGIDEPDVRFVVHASVPDSLDSYYQEIGRDGEPALTALFHRSEDLGLQRPTTSAPDAGLLEHVAGTVRVRGPLSARALRERLGASAARVARAATLLQDAGVLEATARGFAWVGGRSVPQAVAAAVEVAQARARMERSRLEMLRGCAETTACRRQHLLGYFGEAHDRRCARCDVCSAVVVHAAWGPGVVMRPEGDRITVLLEQQGCRTLALAAVGEHALLRRAG